MNHDLRQMCDVQAFPDLENARAAMLQCLKAHIPYTLWMVTHLEGDDWVVAHSLDDGYGTRRGKIFSWSDTYCVHMTRGEGPMFAEDAQSMGIYREAAINGQLILPIGAYIGFPLWGDNGKLAGTLCALDPRPQQALTEPQKLLVCTLGRSLSTLQISYVHAEDARREAERLKYISETDVLTGLANRRGWEMALQDQEEALNRMAQNALIMMVDLDDLKLVNDTQGHEAGDAYLRETAELIRSQFRKRDVIARIGGDEFAILAPNMSTREAATLEERLREALDQARVNASVGAALRLAHDSMAEALAAADAAMYAHKATRKSQSQE